MPAEAPAPRTFEARIPVTVGGRRAIDWLAEHSPVSRLQLKKAMAQGAVWLQTGKRQERLRRATRELPADTVLHLYYDAEILARVPPPATLLADERQYSVWFKPAGLLSQGSRQGDHCALLRVVEQQLQRPVFLVHRLDREASGLMLVAHTEKAAAALSGLFQSNRVRKHYRARVAGQWLPAPLPFRIDTPVDGKPAVTWIDSAVYNPAHDNTVLALRIDTGRKHQIRRHLASVGHPVWGDSRYGRAAPDGLALEACRLEFHCPLRQQPRAYALPDNRPGAFA